MALALLVFGRAFFLATVLCETVFRFANHFRAGAATFWSHFSSISLISSWSFFAEHQYPERHWTVTLTIAGRVHRENDSLLFGFSER
jgi:hypothetical protein